MVDQTVFAELLQSLQQYDDRANENELQFNLSYLQYYGYLHEKKLEDITLGDIVDATHAFQEMAGLSSDGVLGPKTARVMMAPRCGVPDIQPLKFQWGEKEILESKWRKRSLLYFWEAYVAGLPKDVQEDIEMTAWQHWMEVCGIKVDQTRDRNKADIVIGIGQGARSQFDGPGGTLAWAYLPPGDDSQLYKKYDADELWVKNAGTSGREILMENVSCHESGHLLGLEHSKKPAALMAPFYAAALNKPQPVDDVSRVQALYGAPVAPPQPPVLPPTVPPTTPPGKQVLTIEFDGQISRVNLPGYRVTKF